MSAPACIYHIDFTLDPKSHSSAQLCYCSGKRYVEVIIVTDADNETMILEQLTSARRLITALGYPAEKLTWGQNGLDEYEDFLREQVTAISREIVSCAENTETVLAWREKTEYNARMQGKNDRAVYKPPRARGIVLEMPEMVDPNVYPSVWSIITTSTNKPALDMTNHSSAKKLRNYVNNITNNSLQPAQIDNVCQWLVANRDRLEGAKCAQQPSRYSWSRTARPASPEWFI